MYHDSSYLARLLSPQPPVAHDAPAEALLLVDEVAPNSEMAFLQFLLWHLGHSTSTATVIERTSLSNVAPQSSQRYS